MQSRGSDRPAPHPQYTSLASMDLQAQGGTKSIARRGVRDWRLTALHSVGLRRSSLPVPRPPPLPSATIPPYTPKPCLTRTPGTSRGPIITMLHRSRNTIMSRRRPRLLEASLAQFSTVPPPTRSSIRADFICSVYSRGGHLAVLPMYGGALQPCPSQRGGHQVVACIPHHGHVLFCDRLHRDEPPHSIPFLHRSPGSHVSLRATLVPGIESLNNSRPYPQCCVQLEQLASGYSSCQFFAWCRSHSPECLMPAPLLDLPLLHYLLHKPLGYRPSLPHVPYLFGYAFHLSTTPPRCSGLIPLVYGWVSCYYTFSPRNLIPSSTYSPNSVFRTFQFRFHSTSFSP